MIRLSEFQRTPTDWKDLVFADEWISRSIMIQDAPLKIQLETSKLNGWWPSATQPACGSHFRALVASELILHCTLEWTTVPWVVKKRLLRLLPCLPFYIYFIKSPLSIANIAIERKGSQFMNGITLFNLYTHLLPTFLLSNIYPFHILILVTMQYITWCSVACFGL
jgi:hypothetical protein